MKTFHLERRQLLPLPRDEVFAFFSDAGNLEAITPEWLNFRILTARPIDLASGTLIDYRLALFGLPLAWRTRIDLFEPPHRFVDTQVRGPYKLWRHTHEFEESAGGTLMTDRVDYQLYLGPIGYAANAVFVRRLLDRIFDYRGQAIERVLSGCQSAR